MTVRSPWGAVGTAMQLACDSYSTLHQRTCLKMHQHLTPVLEPCPCLVTALVVAPEDIPLPPELWSRPVSLRAPG